MTDYQITQRMEQAQQVLNNEAYRAAMDSLKAQVIQQWTECPIRDTQGQVLLLQLAKLCDKFDGILSGMIEAGKFSQMKIDLDKERDESKVRKLARRMSGR